VVSPGLSQLRACICAAPPPPLILPSHPTPQIVIDNTRLRFADILGTFKTLSDSSYHAIAFYFPETDPVCGRGVYRLTRFVLPLSAPVAGTVHILVQVASNHIVQ
jgi:hypothetical protein